MSGENSTAREPQRSAISFIIFACFSFSCGMNISSRVSFLTRSSLRSARRKVP
ncbi:hypothetical protein CSPAE12_02333 [Colletotrichum incanum]|nr:hypothetical protein CSPAE12_02333 [Colletotrichum incanum]